VRISPASGEIRTEFEVGRVGGDRVQLSLARADTAQMRRQAVRIRRQLVATIGVLALAGVGSVAGPRPSSATAPSGAESCPVFPADNYWHADVSGLPVSAHSEAWLASMGGPSRRLHPDFGPSDEALPYGIPYDVDGSTPKVSVTFDYDDESDQGPYPFSGATTIEGGSDRHALVIDPGTCTLYELYAADWNGGQPTAGSGAVFDLRSNGLRPDTWTSADAAGLPIFPGLLRLDEVRSGRVDHAIRVTASHTAGSYVWPARHEAGSGDPGAYPPMGAWFRMRADVDISGYSQQTQVILTAFKTHGMIVADNGSNWYFTGSADEGWDEGVLNELKSIPAGAFEGLDTSGLMVSPDSGQVRSVTGPPAAPAASTPVAPAVSAPPPAAAPASTTSTSAGTADTTTSTTSTTSTTRLPLAAAAAGPADESGGDGVGPGGVAAAAVMAGAMVTATWHFRRRRATPHAPSSPV
jgi:hypothetical protein